jgi:MFS family permease
LLLGPVLNPINSTMIAVALPAIAATLGVEASAAVWLIASLYLTSAVCQPVAGAIADRLGPKSVFLVGLSIVLVGGALPLLSPTFGVALTARILLGIGTSAAYPSALALIRAMEARTGTRPPPWLMAGISLSALVSASVGPVLGGLLIVFGWQAIYVVNVPIALVGLVLGVMWIPADATREQRFRIGELLRAIDAVGIAGFALTITSLLIFLIDFQEGLWLLAALAMVFGVAFVWWELRVDDPFIDFGLLATNTPLLRTYGRVFLTSAATYLFMFSFAPWAQSRYGLSSVESGLAQLPSALAALLAAAVMSRVRNLPIPLALGAGGALIGGVASLFLSDSSPLIVLIVTGIGFGITQGFGMVANQSVLYLQTPPHQIGTAAGLSRTAMYLGAMTSSVVVAVAFPIVPTDAGMHLIGICTVGIAVVMSVLLLTDRRLPRRV